MKRRKTKLQALTVLAVSVLGMSACASTVSEETCLAGNWEAQGMKDGANGKSSDRLSKIIEACQEYGTSVDNRAYMVGYEQGLNRYCIYQRGYNAGENGNAYNQVCSGDLAEEYAPGYDEGRQRYQIYRQYDEMVERYQYKRQRLYEYRQRLQNPDLTDRQRNDIRYRIRRLENDIDNMRYNIREFERRYRLNRRMDDRDYRRNRDYGY